MNKTRLDLFLSRQYPQYSRTRIKQLIEEGFVLVDGLKKKAGFLLRGGEKIEMKRRAPEIPRALPEPIPLDILFEDDDLLVINKPAGMVVHPAPGNFKGTLVNAILHYLNNPPHPPLKLRRGEEAPPLKLRGGWGELRPGIVHRLDKGTTGVMVVAKNETTLKNLSDQFKQRRVEKTYVALVFGRFPQRSGIISGAIGRDTLHRRKFSSRTRHAREAVTRYRVLKEFPGLSLMEIHPETGRTHQIRVHLSEARHPIVGDTLYGAKSYLSSIKDDTVRGILETVGRPLLHAREIKITHPGTGGRMNFTALLPEDFKMTLEPLGQ